MRFDLGVSLFFQFLSNPWSFCFLLSFTIPLRDLPGEVLENLPELILIETTFSCVSEPFAHGLPCGKRVRWSSLGRRLNNLARRDVDVPSPRASTQIFAGEVHMPSPRVPRCCKPNHWKALAAASASTTISRNSRAVFLSSLRNLPANA